MVCNTNSCANYEKLLLSHLSIPCHSALQISEKSLAIRSHLIGQARIYIGDFVSSSLEIDQSCGWRQGLPNNDYELQDHGRL